jgi:hypothetical protein
MGFLSEFFNGFGFGVSNDILGLNNKPTAYRVVGLPEFFIVSCPFPNTEKRMKILGYTVENGIKILVYDYPGTFDDIQKEALNTPMVKIFKTGCDKWITPIMKDIAAIVVHNEGIFEKNVAYKLADETHHNDRDAMAAKHIMVINSINLMVTNGYLKRHQDNLYSTPKTLTLFDAVNFDYE